MCELTSKRTDHQDRVDNAVHACLCELRDDFGARWDINLIGDARDALYDILAKAGANYPKYPELED